MNQDTVYVASAKDRDGSEVYHLNKKCSNIPGNPQKRNREVMESWDWELCKVCKEMMEKDNGT